MIGCGGHAENHLLRAFFTNASRFHMVAVCDVNALRAQSFARAIKARLGYDVESIADYRRILDMKGIDFVIIATPDHWHAKMALDACLAGKDIYLDIHKHVLFCCHLGNISWRVGRKLYWDHKNEIS